MARKNQRGSSSALPNVPWGSWNIRDEYLSAAEQSNAKSFQSGVEGDKPHTGQSLWCHSENEEAKAEYDQHSSQNCRATKPHTRHRYLEGGTSSNLDQAAQRSSPWGKGGFCLNLKVPRRGLTGQCDSAAWWGAGTEAYKPKRIHNCCTKR